jgi:hypothetical protein
MSSLSCLQTLFKICQHKVFLLLKLIFLIPFFVRNSFRCKFISGRAMAQAVSCWPLTAEARFHAWVSPCGICGEQSGTGTGFSPSSFIYPCNYHSTMALHTRTSGRGMNNTIGLLVAAVQRHSLTPSTGTTSFISLYVCSKLFQYIWIPKKVKHPYPKMNGAFFTTCFASEKVVMYYCNFLCVCSTQ